MKKKVDVKEIAFYGLFTALIFVATSFINIPGPTEGGLFHLGNAMSFTIAIVFGRKAGAISSGLGMALFDVLSPYFVWAPFTFVIRFAMGYVIGHMAFKARQNKVKNRLYTFSGIIMATIIMTGGYYIAEVILFGNFIAPLQSIWGNLMQCIVGTIAAIPFSEALRLGLRNSNLIIDMNKKSSHEKKVA